VADIYDGVFRTILNDCRQLILPLINEIFEENYAGDETIEFYPNEHFIDQLDEPDKKRITDTNFTVIKDLVSKKYHLECESSLPDGRMTIRLFEYDAQIALDEGTVVDGIADNGYKVVVTGNANAGGIEVTAPDPLVNGKAIIVAVNSKGTTSAKILSFEEGQLMLIAEGTSVGADEATVMVMVMTNLNYNVNIPNAAKSWISLIETKSMRNELLTFKIEKNTGSARSATIKLEDSGKNVLQSFTIEQAAGEGSSETEDSGLIIDDWEYETPISL